MLTRLNESDIHSQEAASVLLQIPDTILDGCCLAQQAHAAICAKVWALENRGWELCPHWLVAQSSVANHLDEHLYSTLKGEDYDRFLQHICIVSANLAVSPEVVFAYA